ncbi:RidA family protein [Catenulispora pinisilvae]|uniref:RidA family protein n=2 Tax=Catenulispora pinisilvae TaxID=2705253 RepID=UPI001E3F0A4E|nr:RidA family protein [Catenulispora pinisilvae]
MTPQPQPGSAQPGSTQPSPQPRSPHEMVNPPELAPAVGFSHAVAAGPGRTVYLGGQAGIHPDGTVDPKATLVEQFDLALANMVTTLTAAGAAPEHLVTVTVFATDAEQYRAALKELGAVWRRHLGKHYPAMAFFEVKGLFDPAALVELTGVAVVP